MSFVEVLPVEPVIATTRARERERTVDAIVASALYGSSGTRAALEHLVERAGPHRRVAVLGEMAELGETAPSYHREVGELVKELGVHVIAVGELARDYGGEWVATAGEAADRLQAELRPGDVVLVKGSRSVGLEVVAENLMS